MISAKLLAVNRQAIERDLSETAEVIRNQPVSDGKSGKSDNWVASGEFYHCKLQQSGDVDAEEKTNQGGRNVAETRYVIVLPWDAPVTSRDRLRVNGIVYSITGTNGNVSGRYSLAAKCVIQT
jgi:hypothetical protein